MNKVAIKILQGNVDKQTVIGGLTACFPVANFLQCVCAKTYESWLAIDKLIATINWLTFFWPTLYIHRVSKKTVPTYILPLVCQIYTDFNENWKNCPGINPQ